MATLERKLIGDDGLNTAEVLYETFGEDGARLLPEPTGAALAESLYGPIEAAVERTDAAAERADAAREVLTTMVGDQLPALAELLMPAGATVIMSDPANAILIGDLM
jgi:hypothetical protein